MKKIGFSLTLLLVFGLYASTAFADPVLDFTLGTSTTAGAIAYSGGSNPLTGLMIPVTSVEGIGTPLNGGVTVPLSGFYLDFTTGNFASCTNTGGTGGCTSSSVQSWSFGSGGTIEITDGTTILALGSFTGNPTVADLGAFGTGQFDIAGAVGLDLKNPLLTAYFGLPNTVYTFGLDESFQTGKAAPPSAFSSTYVFSGGSFNNTPTVPEPASLALLGGGLLGLGTLVRRKLSART